MSSSGDQPSQHITVNVPESVVAGVFADFAGVWHTDDYFVLDFASLVQAPSMGETPDGDAAVMVVGQTVARVRVPPSQVIELMKAMGSHLDQWEQNKARQKAEGA